MKRILYTTLFALLATLTPAFAGGRAPNGGQIIELQLTKYGSLQNAVGTAKITFGPAKGGEIFGVALIVKAPDDKVFDVTVVTKRSGVYQVASFSPFLGVGTVKLTLAELPKEIATVADIVGVIISDEKDILLEGAFPSILPQG